MNKLLTLLALPVLLAADRPGAPGAERDIVFKAQGLSCPVVKGIGCGHMLAPVLGRLDKLEGVAGSSANYTGTLVRLHLAAGADRVKVEQAARKVLGEDAGEPEGVLTGEELRRALAREQWRDAGRIGELSAVEFHTVALARFRDFAKAEKLDQATTDKLLAVVEGQWERVAREAAGAKSNTPQDWGRRCKQAVPAALQQAKGLLSPEQLARLKETLATPCRGEDRPSAPPDAVK